MFVQILYNNLTFVCNIIEGAICGRQNKLHKKGVIRNLRKDPECSVAYMDRVYISRKTEKPHVKIFYINIFISLIFYI